MEEILERTFISPEHQKCEKYFTDTSTCDNKFIVRLSFSNKCSFLGDSLTPALKRLHFGKTYLQNLIKLNKTKRILCVNMKNYNMTYLGQLTLNYFLIKTGYFLHHHAVLKNSKTTTKCKRCLLGRPCSAGVISYCFEFKDVSPSYFSGHRKNI